MMESTNQTSNNRMVLLLIAGIPVTMILAATWLWYFVMQGELDLVGALGTANQGHLVQPPRQVDEVALSDQSGVGIKYSDFDRKWSLVIPASGASCDAICENTLYISRQIHVAMGKDFNRIRRIYLSESKVADSDLTVTELSDQVPAPSSLGELLAVEHRGLKPLTLASGAYQQLFPEHAVDASTWYLVDPAGWIMMSYNSEIHYKDVISDLKFLLKNSSE